jgi:hypothetical protein
MDPPEDKNGKLENFLLLMCALMVIAGLLQSASNFKVIFEQGYQFVLIVSAFIINLI